MREGISTNRRCDTSVTCLMAAGKSFVIRYHSRTTVQPEKRLTPVEAALLARGGLEICAVYQDRARLPDDFGTARGVQDGTSAFIYAGQVGQPAGSAIYFAVDTDFSEQQVRSLVAPYFKAIRETFLKAAPQGEVFKLGVYGSGLTCRLLKSVLGLVEYSWLAESTGWRESATYADWDIKQHVNAQNLCDLASQWERCEARDKFGQFVPVGFDVQKGGGTPMMVTAPELNLRVAPTTLANTPVGTLPQNAIVKVLGSSAPGWSRVRATLNGGEVIGHVSSSYLALPSADAQTIASLAVVSLPAASLAEDNPNAVLSVTTGRAYPVSRIGAPPPLPAGGTISARCSALSAIADWLNVQTSPRYQRTEVTFCNVYAADYCYLAGVYLPRVWWMDKAIASFAKGTKVAVAYGQTVREMRADDLHQWLLEYGESFGWRRVFDASALQDAANNGGVGVICADRAAVGKPGHITVVVPEDGVHLSKRDTDGHVTQPLQSQAGAKNYRYGSAGPSWWLSAEFQSFVFFVHA